MTAPVLTLDYAHPQSLGNIDGQIALRRLLILTILSGLCVGSCFLTFTESPIALVIHGVIFTATIVMALRAGLKLTQVMPAADDPSRTRRMVLDVIALAGIAVTGVAPFAYQGIQQ